MPSLLTVCLNSVTPESAGSPMASPGVPIGDVAGHGGGGGTEPVVHLGVPFRPGETFTDEKAGINTSVAGELRDGSLRVRITCP